MDATRGPPRVKNKAAAPVQISAEQLLREAVDRQEVSLQAPTQRFSDLEELHEYQGRKRKEYEDYVRRNRVSLHNWTQYAQWELEQKEFARARSVFERALDVIPHSVQLWIRYIEAEMKSRNVNHARNLLDRAVSILPRVDKLWYKYVYMEEMLGNVPGTRQVFDRWMQWQPDEAAWAAYIKMEKRYGEYDRAREIFRTLTMVHPEPRNWIKWAKFEEEFGTSDLVREVFGSAIETLGDDFVDEKLFIAYARFEAKLKEYERARAIYKHSLDRLPTSRATILQKAYTTFEKQFGDRDGVEDVVLLKRRRHYEQQVEQDPLDYDCWLDYVGLEETSDNLPRTRAVYERAVGQAPSSQDKGQWRRYIYLWIFYAVWEEQEANDAFRARDVYTRCLALIPHRKFTFAKVWLLAAQFEIRQGELTAARKLMGRAIGMCPKDKLFKGYIDLERKLFEFVRCRTLYQKHVEFNPSNCQTWIKFAELERGLDDLDRTRAIFELAVSQPQLDMPELLWKAYIDFEEEEGEYARTRALYERLLDKTNHVKVWISYAHFEINIPEDDEDEDEDEEEAAPVSAEAKARARQVFERAHRSLRADGRKEERVSLLNAWLSFERTHGGDDDVAAVERQMPRRVKRRRRVEPEDGADQPAAAESWEEYVDYVFPADDAQAKSLANMLALAQKWKESTGGGDVSGALGVGRGGDGDDGGGGSDGGDDSGHDGGDNAGDDSGGDGGDDDGGDDGGDGGHQKVGEAS